MYFYHFSYGPSIPVQRQKARFWILIFSSRSRMHRLVLSGGATARAYVRILPTAIESVTL